MTEIMQATTIQNLKKVKEVDSEKDEISIKKLKRYLGQLKFAKLQCENRLRDLDCPGFANDSENVTSGEMEKKVRLIFIYLF